ncbi:MAG: metallophosphoesterase [Candidatus Woesearchaeota archaeon]
MKIGIISDTHDQIEKTKKAISIFNREKVSLVYHLGDLCSPFMLSLFKDLKCNLKMVLGNNDSDVNRMYKFKSDNIEIYGEILLDFIEGKNILAFHGDPSEIVEDLFSSKKYDILLIGHTHKAEIKKNEKTLFINPGTLCISPDNYKNYNWTKPSIAILEIKENQINAKIIKI